MIAVVQLCQHTHSSTAATTILIPREWLADECWHKNAFIPSISRRSDIRATELARPLSAQKASVLIFEWLLKMSSSSSGSAKASRLASGDAKIMAASGAICLGHARARRCRRRRHWATRREDAGLARAELGSLAWTTTSGCERETRTTQSDIK